MGNIHIEIQDTLYRAKRLEEIGSEVQRLADGGIAEIGLAIASAWKGDASEKFQKKFEKRVKSTSRRGKDIAWLSGSLKSSAERMQWVESQAKSIWG